MKNIITIIALSFSITVMAQDFDKNVATAKASYASGDLENTRFALEQALHELDVVIGKEILKQLPTQLGSLNYNEKEDNVTGGSGGMGSGLFVHRGYGNDLNTAKIDVINNSPMITSLNAFLAIPFVGNSADGNRKVLKIQGYKSVLNRNENTETGKTGYTLQIPMNNTLLTLEMEDTNENEIQALANAIPLSKIAQMAQ